MACETEQKLVQNRTPDVAKVLVAPLVPYRLIGTYNDIVCCNCSCAGVKTNKSDNTSGWLGILPRIPNESSAGEPLWTAKGSAQTRLRYCVRRPCTQLDAHLWWVRIRYSRYQPAHVYNPRQTSQHALWLLLCLLPLLVVALRSKQPVEGQQESSPLLLVVAARSLQASVGPMAARRVALLLAVLPSSQDEEVRGPLSTAS